MPTVIAQAPGPAGVAQTLRTMRVLIQASAIDPLIRRQAAQATAHCARADARCQCASMLSWVKRKMRFVPDPAGVEALHDPRMIARAIEDGRDVYGDCDDFSVYLASLLAAIGRKPILRAVGYNGRPYQHVYVVCDGMRLDATKDDWQQPVGLGMLRETSSMLLECESGRLTLSGFFDDLGNMFKRMVKFTPKSFRPANIFRAATSTALTAVTGGAYQFLPSKVKRQVEEVGKIAVPAIAAIAGLNMLAPSVIPTLTSKLGTVANNLGKPLGQIGSALINQMMKLPAPQQAAIAEAVTPADLQQIEQTGQVPEHLQRLLMQSAHQAYYPPPPPGPAGQIPAFAEQPELPRAEAGMIGGANLALWIGLSAVAVLVLQGRPRR
jgi:hypothetical protein